MLIVPKNRISGQSLEMTVAVTLLPQDWANMEQDVELPHHQSPQGYLTATPLPQPLTFLQGRSDVTSAPGGNHRSLIY